VIPFQSDNQSSSVVFIRILAQKGKAGEPSYHIQNRYAVRLLRGYIPFDDGDILKKKKPLGFLFCGTTNPGRVVGKK